MTTVREPEQRSSSSSLARRRGPERRRGDRRRGPASGGAEVGDEVIVNVQALDLGLGSGGFDVVHVNLTRGLSAAGAERGAARDEAQLHEPAARGRARRRRGASSCRSGAPWPCSRCTASSRRSRGRSRQARRAQRLGYVQTEGGALPGGHSRTVRALRERGLLAGHLTAGRGLRRRGRGDHAPRAPCTTACERSAGMRPCAARDRGSSAPGSALGHGGMAALDSAHVALALGCPTLLVARMSSGDERERHRGISHHTLTVLDLLLEPVTVALPAGMRSPVGQRPARPGSAPCSAASSRAGPRGRPGGRAARAASPATTGAGRRSTCPAYAASGLPAVSDGPGAWPRTRCSSPRRSRAAVLAELVRSVRQRARRSVSAARRPGAEPPRRSSRSGGETVYDGRLVEVRIERFRHADGEEVAREIVRHQRRGGDGRPRRSDTVWLVRQPREAVGEPRPARDPRGAAGRRRARSRWQAAQRELAEEIGLGARTLGADPHLLHRRGLHRRAGAPVPRHGPLRAQRRQRRGRAHRDRPLAAGDELDEAIAECADAKTLIGLHWLARAPERRVAPPRSDRGAGAKLEG